MTATSPVSISPTVFSFASLIDKPTLEGPHGKYLRRWLPFLVYMVKLKNPGLLSREERAYLEAIKDGKDPRYATKNPSRTKSRILRLRQNLDNAIDLCVQDISLLRQVSSPIDWEKKVSQMSSKRLESDFGLAVHTGRLSLLKLIYLEDPLRYLLIDCLDALAREGRDPWQAVEAVRETQERIMSLIRERIGGYPSLESSVASQKSFIELLGDILPAGREYFLLLREDEEWLSDHRKESDVLLALYEASMERGQPMPEEVHVERLSRELLVPRRRVTRLLSTLVGKGFVEKVGDEYLVSERGELVIGLMILSSLKGSSSN